MAHGDRCRIEHLQAAAAELTDPVELAIVPVDTDPGFMKSE
jgi:hypothetical protein